MTLDCRLANWRGGVHSGLSGISFILYYYCKHLFDVIMCLSFDCHLWFICTVCTLVFDRIHCIVNFFTDVKNLHDFFNFFTGVANFYKMLGIFRFVITTLKRMKLLENSYL